ncbi:MAG: DUF134 domain-containing protein [Dethiobacteria bacterium]|jgi:predicted DNA-binding protein (UPF0251 family)/DNA-directed RNA polymerase subunit RPC12/RpoP
MARPPISRKVAFLPVLTYFKPAGVPMKILEEVHLRIEELEAVRLKDLEKLDQEACAEQMGISRPTFHRIITSARHKLALALVEGKAIRIEGGNYKFSVGQLHCYNCNFEGRFSKKNASLANPKGADPEKRPLRCPRCGSRKLKTLRVNNSQDSHNFKEQTKQNREG